MLVPDPEPDLLFSVADRLLLMKPNERDSPLEEVLRVADAMGWGLERSREVEALTGAWEADRGRALPLDTVEVGGIKLSDKSSFDLLLPVFR